MQNKKQTKTQNKNRTLKQNKTSPMEENNNRDLAGVIVVQIGIISYILHTRLIFLYLCIF